MGFFPEVKKICPSTELVRRRLEQHHKNLKFLINFFSGVFGILFLISQLFVKYFICWLDLTKILWIKWELRNIFLLLIHIILIFYRGNSPNLVTIYQNISSLLFAKTNMFLKLSIQGWMSWLTNFFLLKFSATHFFIGMELKRRENGRRLHIAMNIKYEI